MTNTYTHSVFLPVILSDGDDNTSTPTPTPTTTPDNVSYPIVDTNQTDCYNTQNSIPCPQPSASYYGQDAQYTGLQPGYVDNGDGTVTDLNTSLMWQQDPGDTTKTKFILDQEIMMEVSLEEVRPKRIATAPPGRGWKPRPEQTVNAEYVRRLLEQHRLTERDEILLRYLDGLLIISSRQIKRLLWFDTSPSNMHRRLRQLYEYYLLDRVRMISKAEGITYTLGRAGRIWLHGEVRGTPAPIVNVRTLVHDLAVAEVLVLFTEELREAIPQCPLTLRLEWLSEARARIVYKDQVLLEPDGMIRLWGDQTYQAYLLEKDRGTERKAAFAAKVKRYQRAYARTELKDEYGTTPEVIIITTSMERAKNMTEVIAGHHDAQRPANIRWRIATLSEIIEKGVYNGAQWYTVQNEKVVGPKILPRIWPED